MPRVQLALHVADLGTATAFYPKLSDADPAQARAGHVNLATADPPLELVLIEDAEDAEDANQVPGTVNHPGVEAGTTDEVEAVHARLAAAGAPAAGAA